MTQNEADILKNAVIDTVEAYVDARLSGNLNFVKTMIGTVSSNPIKNSKGKYEHTVKCNVTSGTQGVEYKNVLSVGNTPFPKNSVVFIIAPNAQFSNMFILGKLDDTPCNISAGSIRLGGHNEQDAPIYLTGTLQNDGSYGHLAGFKIYPTELKFQDGDAISFLTPHRIRLTEFVNGHKVSMMMDTSSERIAINSDGATNNLIVSSQVGWDASGNFPNPENGTAYTKITPRSIIMKDGSGTATIGKDSAKFLGQCTNIDALKISMLDDNYIRLENINTHMHLDIHLTQGG